MKAQDAQRFPSAPAHGSAGLHTRLQALDPRCKLLFAAALGALTWRSGPYGLCVFGLALGLLAWRSGLFGAAQRRALRASLSFLLLWMGLKFGLDLLDAPLALAARQALTLGARLAVLLVLGLSLALAGSSRQYGLALTWALRPVLRDRAWRVGLALALLLHYLALCMETYAGVAAAVRLRRPACSLWRRALLTPQALLRVLGQRTWEQAVALAARRLDSPEAWTPRFPPQPKTWLACLALLAAASGLTWLSSFL